MTREIALHCMKSYSELHSDLCELCPIYGQTGSDHCFEDALQYVIGMLEQEPCKDCISREQAIKQCGFGMTSLLIADNLRKLPPVTPQEPQSFKWCETCKEYDQEKHCCHRYSKVIRDTVAEIEQEQKTGQWYIDERPESNREIICSNCEQPVFKYHKLDFDYRPKYCPNCGADMREVEA